VKVEDIKIRFLPVPDGTKWEVLVEREVRTLDLVVIDHDTLGVPHDPDSVARLREAIKRHALELLEQGQGERIGETAEEVSVASCAEVGSKPAREALAYHSSRYGVTSQDKPAGEEG
jgi:hypothetical protein